jgi:hypothetical protein
MHKKLLQGLIRRALCPRLFEPNCLAMLSTTRAKKCKMF